MPTFSPFRGSNLLRVQVKQSVAFLLLILTVVAVGCGGEGTTSTSTPPPTSNNPVPSISTLAPSTATAGGAAFTLTLNGTGFVSGSAVQWNGSARTATYVSSTQLTAAISAADIASAGSASVAVVNAAPGGGTSAASTFTINAAPVVQYPLVEDLGPIQQNPVINGRDGTFSALINGKSHWTFNDTSMTSANGEGKNFISDTLAWTDNLDASKGIYLNHDYLDSTGHPTEYVSMTPDELQFNAVHNTNSCTATPASTCGEEFALWPGPVVPVPNSDTIYQFYALVLRGGDINGFNVLGVGIANWSASTGVVTRLVASPGAQYPTLMWQGSAQSYGDGAVIDGSNLYALGCATGFLVKFCGLARVPITSATTQSAWTYYTGNDSSGNAIWSSTPPKLDGTTSATLFHGGAAGNSIFYAPAMGKYLAVYSGVYSNDVFYRTADNLWGPWSAETKLFTGLKPPNSSDVNYAGMAHSEFAEQNGNVQYISYVRNTGAFLAQEVRLVRVTFKAPAP